MNLSNHQLAMTVLMTSDMANFSGNVAGGHDPEALSTNMRDVASVPVAYERAPV